MTNQLERAGRAALDEFNAAPTPLADLEKRATRRRARRGSALVVSGLAAVLLVVAVAAHDGSSSNKVHVAGNATPGLLAANAWPAQGVLVRDPARADGAILVVDEHGTVLGTADAASLFDGDRSPSTVSVTIENGAVKLTPIPALDAHQFAGGAVIADVPGVENAKWTTLIESPDNKYYLAEYVDGCNATQAFFVDREAATINTSKPYDMHDWRLAPPSVGLGWLAPETAILNSVPGCKKQPTPPGLYKVDHPGTTPVLFFKATDPARGLDAMVFHRVDARQLVVVPDVVGMTANAANQALRYVGLDSAVTAWKTDEANDGKVLSQGPAAGTEAPKSSLVDLTAGFKPVTMSVADAKAKWDAQKIRNYNFDLQFSPLGTGPSNYRISVRNGAYASATPLDEATRSLGKGPNAEWRTIDQLFTHLLGSASPRTVTEFNPVIGYPESVIVLCSLPDCGGTYGIKNFEVVG